MHFGIEIYLFVTNAHAEIHMPKSKTEVVISFSCTISLDRTAVYITHVL